MIKELLVFVAGLVLFLPFIQGAHAAEQSVVISVLPQTPVQNCDQGRSKVYDECADQMDIFDAGMKRAQKEGKVLMVAYGADWCIWCHVFKKYIDGKTSKFEYSFGFPDDPLARETATLYERAKHDVGAEAAALNQYVADNFVIVNIDSYFTNGDDVLITTGASEHIGGGIPFIYSVDGSGRYAAHFEHDDVAIRRDTDDWYRGYDRTKLLAALQKMHAAAKE